MAELFNDPVLRIKAGKKVSGERFSYSITEFVDRGGSGVVYRARCLETGTEVALKFFLPLYYINLSLFDSSTTEQRVLEELENLHYRELQCLRELNHPSIVRVTDQGSYRPAKVELSSQLQVVQTIKFFVMEYIHGTRVSRFLEASPKRQDVALILFRLADALVYLHEVKQYLHADIRASNILIREASAEPVIIDFALYKNFNFSEVEADDTTRLLGDWDLFPKDLPTYDPLKRFKETRGTRRQLKELCFPGLDLFQFGKLLQSLEQSLTRILPSDEAEFLGLLREDLTTWANARTRTARWLRDQAAKLDPSYSRFMGVEELVPPSGASETLQLPGRVVTLSPLIDSLANTRSFRRLRSINQLTFIDIIYPGAGYRRHLHCLRAYGYCGDLIQALTTSPRFRLFFSENLARQALAIALLHDINHFPLLHAFQEIREECLKDIDLLDLFCKGKATQDSPSIYDVLANIDVSREQFRDIFLLKHHELVEKGYSPGMQIIKSMIDSGADVDKMAYLEDDSLFTGVAYGRAVDVRRLLSAATVGKVSSQGWHLVFREAGLPAVESLVMARYWMFRTVYWHRLNRAIMAMLLHVIRKLYVEAGANAAEFVVDTMWRSEEGVLEYLNDKYRARYGGDSIIHSLLQDRQKIYQRFVSIQGASRDQREADLYEKIQRLASADLEKWRKESLRKHLNDYLRDQQVDVVASEDDVLLDIPGRRLDTAGAIYVELETGEIRAIEDIPGPIPQIAKEFEGLVKRLRVFIHPRIARMIPKDRLLKKRSVLLGILDESLPKPGAHHQVQ